MSYQSPPPSCPNLTYFNNLKIASLILPLSMKQTHGVSSIMLQCCFSISCTKRGTSNKFSFSKELEFVNIIHNWESLPTNHYMLKYGNLHPQTTQILVAQCGYHYLPLYTCQATCSACPRHMSISL